MRDRRWVMFLIAAAVIVLDRVTKIWVENHVSIGQGIVVWPHYFRISHLLNTGAAFSLFEGVRNPAVVRNLLVAFSVVASVVVLVLIWRLGRQFSVAAVALALILGGAIGNMYDRIRYAYVVDFLEVHLYHYHWPDFNVADSAIVVGACLLLLEMLRPQKSSL